MFRLFRITGLCHSNSNSKVNRVERQGGEVGVGGKGMGGGAARQQFSGGHIHFCDFENIYWL